jgi:hypothetical protein
LYQRGWDRPVSTPRYVKSIPIRNCADGQISLNLLAPAHIRRKKDIVHLSNIDHNRRICQNELDRASPVFDRHSKSLEVCRCAEEDFMSQQQVKSCELSASISGRAALLLDQLDLFVQEYGLMMLMSKEPLPAEASMRLAQTVTDCRKLSRMAACLREELTAGKCQTVLEDAPARRDLTASA